MSATPTNDAQQPENINFMPLTATQRRASTASSSFVRRPNARQRRRRQRQRQRRQQYREWHNGNANQAVDRALQHDTRPLFPSSASVSTSTRDVRSRPFLRHPDDDYSGTQAEQQEQWLAEEDAEYIEEYHDDMARMAQAERCYSSLEDQDLIEEQEETLVQLHEADQWLIEQERRAWAAERDDDLVCLQHAEQWFEEENPWRHALHDNDDDDDDDEQHALIDQP